MTRNHRPTFDDWIAGLALVFLLAGVMLLLGVS